MTHSGRSGFWDELRHAFAIPQEDELTEEERGWLETLADGVVQRGLATPALFMLESCRPLNYVGSQALVFFKPILSALFRPRTCDRVADLLSRRGTVDHLVRMIEERRAEQEAPEEDTG
jgi:hypothetical protein